MSEGLPPLATAEIVRLNKIIQALMNRAERSTNLQGSDFSLFQTAVMLEEQVRGRTVALEVALSENQKITRALRESEAKFRGLVDQSLVGIAIIAEGKFNYVNAKFSAMSGYDANEILTLEPLDLIIESDRPLVAEQIGKGLSGESAAAEFRIRGLRKNGAVIDVEIHGSTMNIGGQRAVFCLAMDVSERTRAEREVQKLQEQLREQAIHDPLTGLYNRRYLDETIGRELIRARRSGHEIGLVMCDIDFFKRVNDTWGHLAGDEVLKAFAALLSRNARGSDIVCRYGGEEFVLVLADIPPNLAYQRAENLRIALEAMSIAFGETAIRVTASFGVANFPEHGTTQDELVQAADSAMYLAKTGGRNRVVIASTPAAAALPA